MHFSVSNPASQNRRNMQSRPGMTLVEVIVGLALLASIGTGSVMAFGAHQRQIKTARETIAAVRIADGLLAGWTANSDVPISGSGPTENPGWFWSTQTLRAEVIAGLPVRVVELTILHRNLQGSLQPRCRAEVVVEMTEEDSL